MEQPRQNVWTMKHPALAKAFAVLFAVMSLILLFAGISGISKAQEDNAERVRYENKFADRIENYAQLCEQLEHSITYEELWNELEKEIEQHDEDASQHRTDLAMNTAERGGYTMGANMIWEAVPDFNESRRQLAIAKETLKAQEGNIALLRSAVEGMSELETAISACDALIDKLSAFSGGGQQGDQQTNTPAHECVWDAGEVTKAATCTEAGTMTYKCTVDNCTATKTEEISISTEHSWGEGKVTKAATCTEAGTMTYECTVDKCTATKTEEISISTEHSWDAGEVTKAATCTEAGTMTYKCTNVNCNETKTEDIIIDHIWDEGTVTTEPTVDAKGLRTFYCTNECGESKTEAIDKLTPPSTVSDDPAPATAVDPAPVSDVQPEPEEEPVIQPGTPEVNMAKKNVRVRYNTQPANPMAELMSYVQPLAEGARLLGYDGDITAISTPAQLVAELNIIRTCYANALAGYEHKSGMSLSQMREFIKQYDDGVAAIKAGEQGLNMAYGQLENIWYELDQLEVEREELAEMRDYLNAEAERLSKEIVAADELHELENDRTSAKLLLTSVKEVNDMVDAGGEIIPSAEKYLEDYKAQTQLQHKGWLASCILAIIGGIAGVLAIPAAYELVHKRSWLIVPAVVSVVLAAAAEATYYAVGLGWWYVGMFAAIIGLIHLIIVAPKEKKPGAV